MALPVRELMPKNRARPHRLTIDVEPELYQWMQEQRLVDRLSMSERVRAMLALCKDDPEISARVPTKATEMARNTMQ